MNSKNKSQPSVFVSDGWTKEEKNAFRLDIGMTNDEGKLFFWGGAAVTAASHTYITTLQHACI